MRTDLKKLYFERALKKKHSKRPPKRLPKILYPSLIESRYQTELDEVVRFLKAQIDARIKPLLPGLVKTYSRQRTDADAGPNKYYLAFVYTNSHAQADVLHCTHKYLGQLTDAEMAKTEKIVDSFFATDVRELPRAKFDRRQHFGPNQDIPVLTSANFNEGSFKQLRGKLDEIRADDYPEYRPHVTTDQDVVDLPFAHYALISKAGIHRTWPKTVRLDEDDLGTLASELEKVRIEFTQEYTPEELKRLAEVTGKSVADWNEKQMNGQLKGIVEVDVFGSEPWLAREMGGFVAQNVSLVQSIGDEYIGQVQQLVATGVRSGVRAEDLAADLEDRFDVSRSRANLIARDQIGKFQGQLTELRQKDLGIDSYTWRTSGDARVRDSHRANEGKVFRWDDPPAETGHPGEDYQCRCSAEPVLSDFFEEAA